MKKKFIERKIPYKLFWFVVWTHIARMIIICGYFCNRKTILADIRLVSQRMDHIRWRKLFRNNSKFEWLIKRYQTFHLNKCNKFSSIWVNNKICLGISHKETLNSQFYGWIIRSLHFAILSIYDFREVWSNRSYNIFL